MDTLQEGLGHDSAGTRHRHEGPDLEGHLGIEHSHVQPIRNGQRRCAEGHPRDACIAPYEHGVGIGRRARRAGHGSIGGWEAGVWSMGRGLYQQNVVRPFQIGAEEADDDGFP
jgi:hypothetical protein